MYFFSIVVAFSSSILLLGSLFLHTAFYLVPFCLTSYSHRIRSFKLRPSQMESPQSLFLGTRTHARSRVLAFRLLIIGVFCCSRPQHVYFFCGCIHAVSSRISSQNGYQSVVIPWSSCNHSFWLSVKRASISDFQANSSFWKKRLILPRNRLCCTDFDKKTALPFGLKMDLWVLFSFAVDNRCKRLLNSFL